MTRIGLSLTLRAPALLAAAPPASNLIETLRHLPGNSLRGAFARRYLELGGAAADTVFRRLFVTGDVAFGNALPAGAEVVPLSARTCKYHGGFRADGGHGVVDLLLPPAAGGGERGAGCPVCGESLDHPPSCWIPAERRQATVTTRLITRTAIDAGRGTARTGQLFVQEVLEEGQRFSAEIEAPPELAEELRRLLGSGFGASLGTGASRGQGWVDVAPADVRVPVWSAEPAAARFRRFRDLVSRPLLAVTLLSEGLFFDDYLRDASQPALADLAPLGITPEDWQPRPVQAFAGARRLFGFDGEPLRLPRSHRQAVAAGSTFLFEARGEPRESEGEGSGWIGEGRREGYGRAVLWHPFHLDPDPAGAEETP